jgi:hypothetical protein
MRYLATFLPWIAFAALSSFAWVGGALAALLVAAVLVVRKLRGGVAPDALILEGGTLLYFVVLSLVAALMPNSPIQPYVKVGSSAWLGLVAWTTLAVGKPFTLALARQSTPREYWDLPAFRQVNVVLTTVWAASFTLTALALALAANGLLSTAIQVAGFALPMAFTIRYPQIVQARALRAG